MATTRWLMVALLWLQAIALNQATHSFQRSYHQFLQLRLALLDEPQAACAAHCSLRDHTSAHPEEHSERWTPCRIDLHWWRDRGVAHEICADIAAGAVGLNLASPRRYRVTMTCTLALYGIGLRLPLLSATVFR